MRGKVNGLSVRSGRRLAVMLRNVPPELLPWLSFVTLTYPAEYPTDGRLVKRHLNTLGVWFKREFGEDFRGVWVMEFQKRGAPHFHLLTNVFVPYRLLGRRWFEIVGSGDLNHLKAGVQAKKPREELGGYLLKRYLGKRDQKVVPAGFGNPGRMWGSWGKLGAQLGEVEIAEAVAVKIKRVMRRFIEGRMRQAEASGTRAERPGAGSAGRCGGRRRLRRWVRETKHCGLTLFEGGEILAARLLVWATGEVVAGR